MKTKMRVFAKKALRAQSKQKNIFAQDRKICSVLFSWIIDKKFKRVLLFCPMKHEVDIFPLIWKLKKRGVEVFVPQIWGDDMVITRMRLPLVSGGYQILQSSSSNPYKRNIDVAIVPILGFDSQMGRIGFGKGYYDRFFTRNLHKPYIIFLSRTLIFSKEKITNKNDIKADAVLSAKAFLRFGEQNGICRSKSYFFNSSCNDWIISHF